MVYTVISRLQKSFLMQMSLFCRVSVLFLGSLTNCPLHNFDAHMFFTYSSRVLAVK